MTRRSILPQSRRHLWLYDDDWTFISRMIAPRARLTPGSWCREVIHKVVAQVREDQTARIELATRSSEISLPSDEEIAEE